MTDSISSESGHTGQTADSLTPDMLIDDVLDVYLAHLEESGASWHTVKAFKSDIGLLADWVGYEKTVGEISLGDLNTFLHWMLYERDRPCSPKTYARRVTALKNFFGYLQQTSVLDKNPAAGVIQKTVKSSLPEIAYEDEIERALVVTRQLRADPDKPDTRPHFLINLLLETGIKKGESVNLAVDHVDRDARDGPVLWVRYENPRMSYKERRIAISEELVAIMDEYLAQRGLEGLVFDCTARNLEYVLRDVTVQAGLPLKKLSFETLRWTCALLDYVEGMEPERLRVKLGLSRVSWRETFKKIRALAGDEDEEDEED